MTKTKYFNFIHYVNATALQEGYNKQNIMLRNTQHQCCCYFVKYNLYIYKMINFVHRFYTYFHPKNGKKYILIFNQKPLAGYMTDIFSHLLVYNLYQLNIVTWLNGRKQSRSYTYFQQCILKQNEYGDILFVVRLADLHIATLEAALRHRTNRQTKRNCMQS